MTSPEFSGSLSLPMELYIHKAKVLRVVDGDTIDVQVDCGFRIYHSIRLRLLDYDTPERKEEGFEQSTKYIRECINTCYGRVFVKTERRDGFGRWLAHVWLTNPDTGAPIDPSLNTQMIEYLHSAGFDEYNATLLPELSQILPEHKGLEFFTLGDK